MSDWIIEKPFSGTNRIVFWSSFLLFLLLASTFWLPIYPAWASLVVGEGGAADIIFLLLLLTHWYLSSKRTGAKGFRIFWLGVGLSLFVLFVISLSDLIPLTVLSWQLSSYISSFCYFLVYLLYIIVLELHAEEGGEALKRHRIWGYWIGGPTLIFGFFIYFVGIPAVYQPSLFESWLPSMAFYIVLDSYMIIRFLMRYKNSPSQYWKGVYFWLALMAMSWLLADLIEGGYHLNLFSNDNLYIYEPIWWLAYLPLMLAIKRRQGDFTEVSLTALPRITPWQQLILVTISCPLVHALGYSTGLFNAMVESERLFFVSIWLLFTATLAWSQFRSIFRERTSAENVENGKLFYQGDEQREISGKSQEVESQEKFLASLNDLIPNVLDSLTENKESEIIDQTAPLTEQQEFIQNLDQLLPELVTKPKFNLKLFAKALKMSERQLQRKCAQWLDENPSRVIRRYRIELAKSLLLEGEQVSEVCHNVGYTSLSYFGRCFKEDVGSTPSDYQNLNQFRHINDEELKTKELKK